MTNSLIHSLAIRIAACGVMLCLISPFAAYSEDSKLTPVIQLDASKAETIEKDSEGKVSAWRNEGEMGGAFVVVEEEGHGSLFPKYETSGFVTGKPCITFTGNSVLRFPEHLNFLHEGEEYTFIAVLTAEDSGAVFSTGVGNSHRGVSISTYINQKRGNIEFDVTLAGPWRTPNHTRERFLVRTPVARGNAFLVVLTASRKDGRPFFQLFSPVQEEKLMEYVDFVSGPSRNKPLIGGTLTYGGIANHLKGQIAELRIYDRRLSEAEISTLTEELKIKWNLE